MAILTFPGAAAVLAAHAALLPQPDQRCGPFTAFVALHAVLDPAEVASMVDIAVASGTAIWPHDVPGWRPAGAPLDRTDWGDLPRAPDPESSGTDAAGLARGIIAVTGGSVTVIPVAGGSAGAEELASLLVAIAHSDVPVGVIANIRTGALDPGSDWDVGHFVVIWAVDVDHPDGAQVAIADTYRELGSPGEPPGCRWVSVERLVAAIAARPGRGLLLVTPNGDVAAVTAVVTAAGLDPTIWST